MTAVNLIFLDVDGVINTSTDHLKMSKDTYFVREDLVDKVASIIIRTDARVVLSSTWRFYTEMAEYLDMELRKCLKKRKYDNLGRIDPADQDPSLEKYNDILISVTPDLSQPAYDPAPLPETNHQTRTDEIILWLKENAELNMEVLVRKGCTEHSRKQAALGCMAVEQWTLVKKIKVRNFVCLDDMRLDYHSCYRNKANLKQHFIPTHLAKGITSSQVKEAIAMLENEDFDINQWAEACFVPCDRPNCFHKKVKEDMKFLEEFKRSSLNLKQEVLLPARSKTEPSQGSSDKLEKKIIVDKKKSAPADSGYDFVL